MAIMIGKQHLTRIIFSPVVLGIKPPNSGKLCGLLRTIAGHSNWVLAVALNSTYLLASGSWDKSVKIWNKHSGDLLRTLIGHQGEVISVAFASNNILASGSGDTPSFFGTRTLVVCWEPSKAMAIQFGKLPLTLVICSPVVLGIKPQTLGHMIFVCYYY
jgi:WD40 repeat protein